MEVRFTETAMAQLAHFNQTNQQEILKKIRQLLEAVLLNPYQGIGKPEQLKHQYSGYWSRRINKEHRLIYKIQEASIVVYSVKGHY